MEKLRALFKEYIHGDKNLWRILLLMCAVSVLAVYSSTANLAYSGEAFSYRYIIKHVLILIASLLLVVVIHRIRYVYAAKASLALVVVSIFLILLAWLQPEINHTHRWVTIAGVSFQPSELAKVALVLYLSRILTRFNRPELEKKGFVYAIVSVLLVVGLILKDNLSTALILGVTCYLMLIASGFARKYMRWVTLSGVVLVSLFVGILFMVPADKLPGRMPTWKSRIVNSGSTEGDSGYQRQSGQLAVANGKIFGVGPGNSTQRQSLPNPFSDYIYALIIEEYGLVGGITVMALYLWFLFKGLQVARRASGTYGRYAAYGITTLYSLQAFTNMAVGVSLGPVTGQPLPFISMGGTSMLLTSIGMGVLLNISAEEEKKGLEVAGSKDRSRKKANEHND